MKALQTTREAGNPIPWIELFLEAVKTQAIDAVARAQRIVALRETYRVAASSIPSSNGMALVDLVCGRANVGVGTRESIGHTLPGYRYNQGYD